MKTFWMIMIITSVVFGVNGQSVAADMAISNQVVDIIVSNHVSFLVHSTSHTSQIEIVTFAIYVENKGDSQVPDLRLDHIEKYTKFIVNGQPEISHLPMDGGMEDRRDTLYLSKGESHQWGWGQTYDADSEPSTIQWEYLGVRSPILEVNWENKSVREIIGKAKSMKLY